MVGCSVLGCSSRSEKKIEGLTFHNFTKDPNQRDKWISATGRCHWKPTKFTKICSMHFDKNAFVLNNNIKRIGRSAVPKLNVHIASTSCVVHSSVPSISFQETPKGMKRKSEDHDTYYDASKCHWAADSMLAVPKVVKTASPDVECRACLKIFQSNTLLFSLFESWVPPWDGMENTIADDLAKLVKIQLSPLDSGSKHICVGCSRKLKEACHFIAFVQNNDRIQRERHQHLETESPEKVWPKPIQVEKNLNVCDNSLNVEVKKEVLSEDENEANEMDYSCREEPSLVNLDIKIEPEEIIQPPPIQITVNGTVSMGGLNFEIEAVTNGFAEEAYKETDRETGKETDKETDKGTEKETDREIEKDKQEEAVQEPVIKQEPASDEEATCLNVESDLPLKCLLCSKDFNTITGLKAHVIAQHSYKGVKRKLRESPSPEPKQNNKHFCVTCQRGFVTSTDLMVHETCHSKQECSDCKEKFDTFEQLSSHRSRCKMRFKINVRTLSTLQNIPQQKRPLITDSPKNIVGESNFGETLESCEQQNVLHNLESTSISVSEIKTEVIDSEAEQSGDCDKLMETLGRKTLEAPESEENSVWSLDSVHFIKSEVNDLENKAESVPDNSMEVDLLNMKTSEGSKLVREQNTVLGLVSESDIKHELIDLEDSGNSGLCDNPNQLVTHNMNLNETKIC